MTRPDVGQLLGPPRSERRFSDEDHRESRGRGSRSYDVVLEYAHDRLMGATFPFQVNGVTILGMNVFAEPPARLIARLKDENGGFYVVDGSSFSFERLGVALNDWLEDDASDKWIAAMSREGYAEFAGLGRRGEVVR